MNSFKVSVSALALTALTAGGFAAATLLPTDLRAQTDQSAPAPAVSASQQHHRHHDPARRVEGRIAYLKAMLKITPAQEPEFGKLADAMRANAQERAAAFEQFRQNRDKPKTAVDRLETREHMTRMRAEQEARSLAALKPLYDSLSPEQKQVADDMTAPHWGHHYHRG
jgi:LTXXQ motif family protein